MTEEQELSPQEQQRQFLLTLTQYASEAQIHGDTVSFIRSIEALLDAASIHLNNVEELDKELTKSFDQATAKLEDKSTLYDDSTDDDNGAYHAARKVFRSIISQLKSEGVL